MDNLEKLRIAAKTIGSKIVYTTRMFGIRTETTVIGTDIDKVICETYDYDINNLDNIIFGDKFTLPIQDYFDKHINIVTNSMIGVEFNGIKFPSDYIINIPDGFEVTKQPCPHTNKYLNIVSRSM